MNTRHSWVVGAALLVVGFMLGLLSGQRSAAEPPNGQPVIVGRYQMIAVGNTDAAMVDTATGNCWAWTNPGGWNNLGSPTQPKKEKEER
jgi:hypothetical protein